MKKLGLILWAAVTVGLAAILALLVDVHPATGTVLAPPFTDSAPKHGDQELAYMLVKLELRTRATMSGDYMRRQSIFPGVDIVYRRWLAKNAILPAAIADRVYADVVPSATGGRAWVKMVVAEPRNPHNIPDSTASALFEEIRRGAKTAEKQTAEAYYYAEPIKATEGCMPCHGAPRGSPDPMFPGYKLEGWRAGDTIGAVIARVAPDSQPSTGKTVRKQGPR